MPLDTAQLLTSLLLGCRYLDAEERYQTRESRPEDLEEIQKLKASVTELQTRIKEMAVCPVQYMVVDGCPPVTLPLQAELRIYQLELANREKNYNKLFGVNPVVGVLDPVTSTVSHMQLVCWDDFFKCYITFF